MDILPSLFSQLSKVNDQSEAKIAKDVREFELTKERNRDKKLRREFERSTSTFDKMTGKGNFEIDAKVAMKKHGFESGINDSGTLNAVTHALTMARLEYTYGARTSKGLETINEMRPNNKPHDEAYDRYNDLKGSHYLNETIEKGGTWKDVEKRIIEAAKNRELLVDPKNHTEIEQRYNEAFPEDADALEKMKEARHKIEGRKNADAIMDGIKNSQRKRAEEQDGAREGEMQVASLDDAIGLSSPKKSRPLPSSRFVGVFNEETGELEKHPKFDELMKKDAPMTDEEKKDLAELFHINMNVGMGNYPKEDMENEHDNGFTYKDALVRQFGYVRDKNGKATTMVLMPQDDPDFKPKREPNIPVPRTRLEAALSGVEGFAEAMNKPVTMNIQDTPARDPGSIAATKTSPVRDDNNGLGKAFNPYGLDNPDLAPDEAESVYDSTFGKGGDSGIYDALSDKTNPYRPRLMKNKQRLSQMAYGPRRPSVSGSFGSAPGQSLV